MSPLERDPVTGEYIYVSHDNAKRGRGRPKIRKAPPDWLGRAEQDNDSLPEEIELSEDAPMQMQVVASFTNFLNGHDMDHLVESKLKRMGVDPDLIRNDRVIYSKQVQRVRDKVYEEYCELMMDIGDYIIGDTTFGMGSIMAAMNGESCNRGKRSL